MRYVYLASSINDFYTEQYEAYRTLALQQFVTADRTLFEPRLQGWSNYTWLETLPKILSCMDVLCILPLGDRTITRGVQLELENARLRHIPVYAYWNGALRPYRRMRCAANGSRKVVVANGTI
jgi:hypothetical protein